MEVQIPEQFLLVEAVRYFQVLGLLSKELERRSHTDLKISKIISFKVKQ